MSPPRLAAILLALLLAAPLAYLLDKLWKTELKPTVETVTVVPEQTHAAKKEDKANLNSDFLAVTEDKTTHTVKAYKIEKPNNKIEPAVTPPTKLHDEVKKEEPEQNVCEESGGYKVSHGRSWHCVYPHRHRHHRRHRG